MTADGWRIERASIGEIDAVLALERTVGRAPHWSRADYAAIFEQNGGEKGNVRRALFTASGGDSLLGFAVGSVRGDGGDSWSRTSEIAGPSWGELESVAVAEAARRRGIGRALCAAVLAWCRDERAAGVELEVRAGSVGAQVLYRELGFVETGCRRGYYADPVEDAVLLHLPLRAEVL